mgnify:CR=1 FL=1
MQDLLDIMTSRTIVEFIRDARQRGHAIIFSTHILEEVEQACSRVIIIDRGKIVHRGPSKQLQDDHDLQHKLLSVAEG